MMKFNKEKNQWVLGKKILEVVDSYTYLVLEVDKEGKGGENQKRINEGKAKRMIGMIINRGIKTINNFEVGRSLW